eukprot:7840403-Pyramimonas_sp.AAC.1
MVRQLWAATGVVSLSAGGVFVDLHAAFYPALKQLCLSLPSEAHRLEDALLDLEMTPFLAAGLEAELASQAPLDDVG